MDQTTFSPFHLFAYFFIHLFLQYYQFTFKNFLVAKILEFLHFHYKGSMNAIIMRIVLISQLIRIFLNHPKEIIVYLYDHYL